MGDVDQGDRAPETLIPRAHVHQYEGRPCIRYRHRRMSSVPRIPQSLITKGFCAVPLPLRTPFDPVKSVSPSMRIQSWLISFQKVGTTLVVWGPKKLVGKMLTTTMRAATAASPTARHPPPMQSAIRDTRYQAFREFDGNCLRMSASTSCKLR